MPSVYKLSILFFKTFFLSFQKMLFQVFCAVMLIMSPLFINIFKPLSISLSPALAISLVKIKKYFCERQESNPGLLDEKRISYFCAMPPQ